MKNVVDLLSSEGFQEGNTWLELKDIIENQYITKDSWEQIEEDLKTIER